MTSVQKWSHKFHFVDMYLRRFMKGGTMKYENLLKMLDLRLDLFIDGSVFCIPDVGIIHENFNLLEKWA